MRGINSKSSAVGLSWLVAGGSLILAHCGGGDSAAPPSDASPEADDQAATGDGGSDATVEAGEDATGDAAPQPDAAPDATLDTSADAAPDASPDVTPDGPAEGGEGGADADAAEAGIPCDVDAQTPCVGASTVKCCSGFCVDTAADPANCGHCGTACTSHQFCTGTACDDAIISNICANPRGTVVLDQFDPDNEAGTAIGAALTTSCSATPVIVFLSQDAGGVLDPATDRPITGVGNTFINGGGSYGQRGIAYLDQAGLSALYLSANGGGYQIESRNPDAGAIVDAAPDSLTSHHDFFYVQLVVEPQSGTLCFSVVGIFVPGTMAGGYYVPTQIIPHRSTYTNSWYVFEWIDSNNDGIANAGDTFTQVASGS